MSEQLLRPKLENIISGHNINNDDADWLRAALAQYADGAEVAAYRLRDEEASTHYGKDVYVYWSKDEFRDHPDKPKLLALLEPLYAAPPANQEQKCAQCQKPYKHGTNKAGCPKCAPGVRIAEVEFQKPLHASQEQADCAPFGYFRPEPFGWTDCAKTDDGAIALYEHPAEVEQLKNELRLSDDMLKAVADLCQKYERWLEFLHKPNKDSEGFEWGIARVKFDGDKTIALWTNQDHSDLDAAIDAAQAERAKGG